MRHAAGLSLREASASEVEGLKRSHNAIWKWIQRFAPKLFEADKAKKPKIIVLDETSINIGGEIVYLHATINPESRRILLLRLYPSRSTLSVYAFMMEFIKRYGRPKLVCTDGGHGTIKP
ncbi:MAG: DDE-type integrase/transposase/recombinase [Aigarchaeota archaeon]|nr:DDE-type integrase/transposase/recombinase [Candidatus Pelearchaeum maunauluense]